MTRRNGERRTRQPSTESPLCREFATDRRISGIADRRKEIHAELAELYKRRCDDCTSTCVHSQQEARP